MNNKKIIVMCGLPRSGKSTWINKNKNENDIIISADDWRYIVYNQRYWQGGEPLMWSIRSMMLEYLMIQGKNIIIDETNTTVKRRKPIIDIAKKYDYTIICNIIEGVLLEDCIKRAIDTNRQDVIPIIKKMNEQFELPTLDEGFDLINMV